MGLCLAVGPAGNALSEKSIAIICQTCYFDRHGYTADVINIYHKKTRQAHTTFRRYHDNAGFDF
jgi:hypothetical protein